MAEQVLKDKWYVLYTANKRERAAREHLKFRTVVPVIEMRRTKRKRGTKIILSVVVVEPKYPNYIFVQHDGSKDFFGECLRSKYIVSFAGGVYNSLQNIFPPPMSKDEVKNIFQNELRRKLGEGALIQVIEGPYMGLIGKVLEKIDGECKVALDLYNLKVTEIIPQEFIINYDR